MAALTKRQNYIRRVQVGVASLARDVTALQALLQEGSALGHLAAGVITDADVQTVNTSATAAQFAAAVTTLQSLEAALAANGGAGLGSLLAVLP